MEFFFICHANVDLESDADSSIGPTHRYVARAMRPALSWSYINAIIMLVLVIVFSWFISEPASSIFSYTKSAPATNQPTVLLFHNKSALATSHSQTNRMLVTSPLACGATAFAVMSQDQSMKMQS